MMTKIEIVPYEKSMKEHWDKFVRRSKNGTFLLYRDYMDYHADRFVDCSPLFFEGDTLVAVMPANKENDVLTSHGGLTYGGVISDNTMRTATMIKLFETLLNYVRSLGITKIVYKAIPHIYHSLPAEEDLYVLFLQNAKLVRRDVSSAIKLSENICFKKGKKGNVKKCTAQGVHIRRNDDFKNFMTLLQEVLDNKYGVRPTHSYEEIQLLADRFPDHIKLFEAVQGETILAGAVVYETRHVAHAQYIASSLEGEHMGASDFLLDYLINMHFKNKAYFDFGISTEQQGRYLNQGLIRFKENCGARAITYDFYELDIPV